MLAVTDGEAAPERGPDGRYVEWSRQKVSAHRDYREWYSRRVEARELVDTAATGSYLLARVARGTAWAHPGVTRHAAELSALFCVVLGRHDQAEAQKAGRAHDGAPRSFKPGELAALGWVAALDLGLGRGAGAVVSLAQVAKLLDCSDRTAGTRVRLLVAIGALERVPHYEPTGQGRFCRRGPNVLRVSAQVREVIERPRGAGTVRACGQPVSGRAGEAPRRPRSGRQELPAIDQRNPIPERATSGRPKALAPLAGAAESRPAAAGVACTSEGTGPARDARSTVTPSQPHGEAPEAVGSRATAETPHDAPTSTVEGADAPPAPAPRPVTDVRTAQRDARTWVDAVTRDGGPAAAAQVAARCSPDVEAAVVGELRAAGVTPDVAGEVWRAALHHHARCTCRVCRATRRHGAAAADTDLAEIEELARRHAVRIDDAREAETARANAERRASEAAREAAEREAAAAERRRRQAAAKARDAADPDAARDRQRQRRRDATTDGPTAIGAVVRDHSTKGRDR